MSSHPVCPRCGFHSTIPMAQLVHDAKCKPEEEQPVRELAETIVAGHAFADVDAVRVARAFLRMDEEGT